MAIEFWYAARIEVQGYPIAEMGIDLICRSEVQLTYSPTCSVHK